MKKKFNKNTYVDRVRVAFDPAGREVRFPYLVSYFVPVFGQRDVFVNQNAGHQPIEVGVQFRVATRGLVEQS